MCITVCVRGAYTVGHTRIYSSGFRGHSGVLKLKVYIYTFYVFVGQTADSCDHGDIRLVGGSNNLQGRVDVCFEGVWGQMCGLRWDDREAQVVCRQLNLNPSK